MQRDPVGGRAGYCRALNAQAQAWAAKPMRIEVFSCTLIMARDTHRDTYVRVNGIGECARQRDNRYWRERTHGLLSVVQNVLPRMLPTDVDN
jgi:hypothetical protein